MEFCNEMYKNMQVMKILPQNAKNKKIQKNKTLSKEKDIKLKQKKLKNEKKIIFQKLVL